MTKRLIEYSLVVLVAIIVSMILIWLFLRGGSKDCEGCAGHVSLPLQRQECEKQFFGSSTPARVLEAGGVGEYLLGFFDPVSSAAGGGYPSSPGGYSAPGTSPATPVSGYVIVRARPQTYDYNTGTSSSAFNPASVKPNQVWQDVRLAVVTYASPLRNESVADCAEQPVVFREDKFEAFCDLPTKFAQGESAKQTYRVYIINDSDTPVEYCIVSNCDESHGKACQIEMASGQ